MRRRGWLLLALVLVGGVPAAAQQLAVRVEPAVALPNGGALVPFRLADSTGAGFPVRAGEITAEADGGAALASELLRFEGVDAEPYRVHVLVDAHALGEGEVADWAEALARFAQSDAGREERAVFGNARPPVAWATAGTADASAGTLRERLAGKRSAPLWDGVLHILDGLAAPGPPDRRVLIVVTNGEEETESKHPVATCADAADTARVSVWLVSPRTPPAAARARLQMLAARTGGEYLDSRGRGGAALDDALRRIRATQALRLRSLPAAPPVAITMKPGIAAAAPARAWIRVRRGLGIVRAPFPWLPVGGALAAALLAGGLVVRRKLAVGSLCLADADDGLPVTRSGLTIGAAAGNGFVVAHPRVSRHHAVIRWEKGRAVLADLRSSNGTKVNGRPVSSAPLHDGDRIVLADAVELIYSEGFRFRKRG